MTSKDESDASPHAFSLNSEQKGRHSRWQCANRWQGCWSAPTPGHPEPQPAPQQVLHEEPAVCTGEEEWLSSVLCGSLPRLLLATEQAHFIAHCTSIEHQHQYDKKFCSIFSKKEPDIQKHTSLAEKYGSATPKNLTLFFLYIGH